MESETYPTTCLSSTGCEPSVRFLSVLIVLGWQCTRTYSRDQTSRDSYTGWGADGRPHSGVRFLDIETGTCRPLVKGMMVEGLDDRRSGRGELGERSEREYGSRFQRGGEQVREEAAGAVEDGCIGLPKVETKESGGEECVVEDRIPGARGGRESLFEERRVPKERNKGLDGIDRVFIADILNSEGAAAGSATEKPFPAASPKLPSF